MVEIHKSGFFIPNIIGSQYLYFIEEILGKDRLKAILKQANLDDLITKTPQNNYLVPGDQKSSETTPLSENSKTT